MRVAEIFETMEYGPAPESAKEAEAWLERKSRAFGLFIDGAFRPARADFESRNPATGALLATLTQANAEEVTEAVAAARTAGPGWAGLSGHQRARYLYALARLLQKHARLFAVLETLDTGKPIRESRDIDIPLVQRHFYYHAGMAQLMEAELPERAPLGVCGQIIPWNFPLLMLAWKIAPALAMGNTVVLKPAEYTSLTALLFAEICGEAGLPPGVVNIVTGDGEVGEKLTQADVDKIAFTGSTEVGRKIRAATAGTGKALTLELGGKSPYIVFEDADLDSAVEGLVDAIWFNQGQVCCAGSRLLVQESVADGFYARVRARMDKLRVGDPLDKSIDIGAIVDPVQRDAIAARLAAHPEGTHHVAPCDLPDTGCFYPPTLITDLGPADALMQEEIFGPVLVATTFRTPAEAVSLANNTRYGLAASVWTETLSTALDIAPKLAAGVVWVNGTNMFDAAAGFGGVRESGFGREGGWEGLRAYTKPKRSAAPLTDIPPFPAPDAAAAPPAPPGVDRTSKLYIAGKQTRPDGGYSTPVYGPRGALLGQASCANRKDVRNAVEAATAAAGWAASTAHLRAQILYYIAENLSARRDAFASLLDASTGTDQGAAEVDAAVSRLFTYAAWADKRDGAVKAVPLRGVAMAMQEPVGVIGALCPAAFPLLGLVSVMAPAIAMGNRVVLAVSEPFPLPAMEFQHVLGTSDVPAGVVNLLSGTHADTASTLAAHLGVDAMWSFGAAQMSGLIEQAAAGNLKRSWVNYGLHRDWMGADGEGSAFLDAATETKTIWVPYGA